MPSTASVKSSLVPPASMNCHMKAFFQIFLKKKNVKKYIKFSHISSIFFILTVHFERRELKSYIVPHETEGLLVLRQKQRTDASVVREETTLTSGRRKEVLGSDRSGADDAELVG